MRVLPEKSRALLEERYLNVDGRGQRETVEGMFRRVTGGDDAFFELLTSLDFLPNSPALFNANTGRNGTVFACFTFYVADSMDEGPNSILATRRKAALVAKWGGGTGYYVGDLRPRNSLIQSTHKKACGPCAVIRDYNGLNNLITQGGKRDLAQIAVCPSWHPDAEEFVDLKHDAASSKALRAFNISLSWQDQYFDEVRAGKPGRSADLFAKQVDHAWATGCPGLRFEDVINRRNPVPYLGRLLGCNPCGEVDLYNDEPCDLGSMNLRNFVTKNRTFDFTRLYERARLAQRFLDYLHDINVAPVPEIDVAAKRTRKTGLGVMGWGDVLCLLHIHYDTPEAVALADKVQATVNRAAYDESLQLAKEKGPFLGYDADKATTPPVRNATRTCIAPTGSIYLIAGLDSSGIEPHIDRRWERKTYEGLVLEESLDGLVREAEGFEPHLANEIHWRWHVKHQAAFQRHTDLSVSKTINMANSATREDVRAAYLELYESGCNGGTIYRDRCRPEQVLVKPGEHNRAAGNYDTRSGAVTVPAGGGVNWPLQLAETVNALPPEQLAAFARELKDDVKVLLAPAPIPAGARRRKLPRVRENSLIIKIDFPEFEGYAFIGCYEDGSPGELFFRASKEGSTLNGLLDSWAISVSLALQHQTPLRDLVRLYAGTRFEPCGLTGDPDVPVCTSIADYIFRWLAHRFGLEAPPGRRQPAKVPALVASANGNGHVLEVEDGQDSGLFCPECHARAVLLGGCIQCRSCSYSKCG